jgi:hypothetical protein
MLYFVIIAVGFYFKSWWGAIGIIPIFAAAMGHGKLRRMNCSRAGLIDWVKYNLEIVKKK